MNDIKGENWALTAGWRQRALGSLCLKFDPTCDDGSAARYNPLHIIGNYAAAGDGGGISLFRVNGQDIDEDDNGSNSNDWNNWHSVRIYNNIIVNNVAEEQAEVFRSKTRSVSTSFITPLQIMIAFQP